MGQPYVGEIRIFAGNFAPNGWYFCDGTILPISENETLFTLVGTTYGGDGETTFALPDLRGRAPIHDGPSTTQGEMGGVEQVTLTSQQLPAHSHVLQGTAASASSTSPSGNVPASQGEVTSFAYGTDAPRTTLSASALTQAGASQPHDNLQPYLTVNFIISAFGIFPSPS